MPDPSPVFERHYKNYLARLAGLDFSAVGPAAGADVLGANGTPALSMAYFTSKYTITGQGITGPAGNPAAYDVCAILSRYLIMASDRSKSSSPPVAGVGEWTNFRDLREAGPLTVYFRDNVEALICGDLAGNASRAALALAGLGGTVPDLGARYDLMLEFRGLPHIPMLLLFNDAEEMFPASCSVLFRSDVDSHLDAECIAMMGYRLAILVREAMKAGTISGH